MLRKLPPTEVVNESHREAPRASATQPLQHRPMLGQTDTSAEIRTGAEGDRHGAAAAAAGRSQRGLVHGLSVLWRGKSSRFHASVAAGALVSDARGGDAYDLETVRTLTRVARVDIDPSAKRRPRERALGHVWRLLSATPPQADIVISDPFVAAWGRRALDARHVAMVHHFPFELTRGTLAQRTYLSRLRRRLKTMDTVVTVSEFWKTQFEKMGCQDVRVVHNALDPARFRYGDKELAAFRQRFDLPPDKPLIYAGNAQIQKGVTDVYDALKDEPYTLVMTGPREESLRDLPVRWLDLRYDDYVRLLAAADVVVTMSRMTEGWCRTAHEALLCGTPVIGSGTGGMRELLEGAGQAVVAPKQLAQAVRDALHDKDRIRHGREFAERFTPDRFNQAWERIIRE